MLAQSEPKINIKNNLDIAPLKASKNVYLDWKFILEMIIIIYMNSLYVCAQSVFLLEQKIYYNDMHMKWSFLREWYFFQ